MKLQLALLLSLSPFIGKAEKNKVKRPNILVIMADDLGYGDLSCYGSQSIETPNIDALAAQGMRFTRFYSGSAVSSPSRACFLTGNFPLRYDIRQHLHDSTDYLVPEAFTMAEMLRENGYKTYHIGKWHLGGLRLMDIKQRNLKAPALPGPLQHGFDYYLTNVEGAPIRDRLIEERKLYREGGKYLVENDKRINAIHKPWEQIKAEKAIEIIDIHAQNKQPFFINLWFDTPHTPYEPAPEPHLSKYAKTGTQGDQLYFRSMVSQLDEHVGKVISELKRKKIFDNTIIIFTSDNGPAFQGSPGPFKGGKTDLHEGGIRVPFFIIWNKKIKPGHTFETGHFADIFPTIFDFVNNKKYPEKIDGRSIKPLLCANESITDQRILLWQMDLYEEYQNQGKKPQPYITTVATMGNWKMTAIDDKPVELFNLAQDHRELYNLLGTQPEIESKLYNAIVHFLNEPRFKYDQKLGFYD